MAFLRYGIRAGVLAAAFLATGAALAGSFDSENLMTDRKLSSFESVYVAPVETDLDLKVYPFDHSGRGDRPVSNDDAATKAADFHDELVDEFGKSFSIVSAPGPGVLTVSATLTKLASSRPTLADYDREASISFDSIYAGGGAMRVVFSEDGTSLAEVSDQFNTYLNDGRVRAGVWQDTDRAFRQWAHKLAKYVEQN